MRSYFRLRARLVPYLYTAQRSAYATGLVPVHALYYDFPAPHSGAYTEPGLHQYAFGPSMWVAPVTVPAAPGAAGLASVNIWFPPGPWFEWGSWQVHHGGDSGGGGAVYPRAFALEETPVFSPPGAIIPLSGDLEEGSSAVGSAVRVPSSITFYVLPPPPGLHLRPSAPPIRYTSQLYDDDGVSTAYTAGGYAWSTTACAWARSSAGLDSVECSVDQGGSSSSSEEEGGSSGTFPPIAQPLGFAEAPPSRSYTFRFLAAWPPSSVTLGGVPLPYAASASPDAAGEGGAWPAQGSGAWSYHGDTASVWVKVGDIPWGTPKSSFPPLRLLFPAGASATDALLSTALPRKIARAQAAKGAMNRASWTVNPCDVPALLAVAGAGARVEAAVGASAAGGSSAADMWAAVAGIYGGLGEGLRSALGEVQVLLDRHNMGEEETRAVEDMKKLVGDALR